MAERDDEGGEQRPFDAFDEAAFYALFAGGDLPDPMVEDEDDDDDLPRRDVMPQDDRIWRHPSELGGPAPLMAGRAPRRLAVPRRRRRDRWGPVLAAGAVGGLLCAGVVALADVGGRPAPRAALLQGATGAPAAVTTVAHRSVPDPADLAESIQRSVIGLTAMSGTQLRRGSAVVVLDGSSALTAAHLVDPSTSRVAVIVDGTERSARVIGRDPMTDLALVVFDGPPAPTVTWGDLDGMRAGQQAIAVGAGGSRGPSVSSALISSLSQSAALGGVEVHGLLEFDRAPTPDTAGGALLDGDGAVVGITLAGSEARPGYCYALPADQAGDVARQLADSGRAIHAWLGVEGVDRGIPNGVVVRSVQPGSPAARTGVLAGEVITGFDGSMVVDMDGLLATLRSKRVGDTIVLTVWHGSASRTIRATLTDHI